MLFVDKLRPLFCPPVAVAVTLLLGSGVNPGRASDFETPRPCARQSADQNGAQNSGQRVSPRSSGKSEDNPPAELAGPYPAEGQAKSVRLDFCLGHFERSLVSDQKAVWASPFHLHARDRSWLVPLGMGTLALVAADNSIMRHLGTTPFSHSSSFSNYGLAALVASGAGLYLRGAASNDGHSREAGWLAGEAAVNSVIVAETMKLAFRRPRPTAANGGSCGSGGASFPSEHAMAAWSIAGVIVREYPGPLTKLLAYGAASGITLARVGAREHFPSDVAVGSALGYLVGRYVYRAHHDPELPGASLGNFEKDTGLEERAPPRRRPPSELGSPSVPLDSWVYAAFSRLAALGYAPSAYLNLRPWTRMECARIIAAAGDDLDIKDLGIDDLKIGHLNIVDQGGSGQPGNSLRSHDPHRDSGNDPGIAVRDSTEAHRIYVALAAEFANDLGRLSGAGTSEVRVDSIYTRYLGIAGTPLDDGYHFGQTLIDDFGRLYGDRKSTR